MTFFQCQFCPNELTWPFLETGCVGSCGPAWFRRHRKTSWNSSPVPARVWNDCHLACSQRPHALVLAGVCRIHESSFVSDQVAHFPLFFKASLQYSRVQFPGTWQFTLLLAFCPFRSIVYESPGEFQSSDEAVTGLSGAIFCLQG